jgi:hypothetical protein
MPYYGSTIFSALADQIKVPIDEVRFSQLMNLKYRMLQKLFLFSVELYSRPVLCNSHWSHYAIMHQALRNKHFQTAFICSLSGHLDGMVLLWNSIIPFGLSSSHFVHPALVCTNRICPFVRIISCVLEFCIGLLLKQLVCTLK